MAMQQILIGYTRPTAGGGGNDPSPNYSTLFDGDGYPCKKTNIYRTQDAKRGNFYY